MTEQKLEQLLQDLTLEEKVYQLVQLPGICYQKDAAVTGGLDGSNFTKKDISKAGSALGIWGAENIKRIQKEYMEQQPHHIPLLFMLDVIHGFRTIFPMPLAQGATFDPEMSKACAEVAAKEAAVSGVHVTFAPMSDLVRDARWGRVMESTGEDSFLNSQMTAAMVQGFQGEHVGEYGRVAACVKHFAGYGAPVAGREYNTVELSEHTLREFYLPAYQAGIQAGSELVMTSFNTLNGIPSSGNQWLMRKVLREEMGFKGVLISDWAAIEEMIAHGFCEDGAEATLKAMEAGVDIDMVTSIYANHLEMMVERGQIAETLVDEAVMRILRLKNKLGLFEHPYKDGNEEKETEVILCKEHRELARKAVRESLVLLKNDAVDGNSLLPLNPEQKITWVGPYVETRDMHSSWAITGISQDAITIREAVTERIMEGDIKAKDHFFYSGSRILEDGMLEEFHEAVVTVAKTDLAVVCIGESRLQSGEAASRGELTIPEPQMQLLRAIRKATPHVVTLVFSGRPLDLREVSELSEAVLEVWMPGTEGARGILDVLMGAYNPSGKLPMSFPYCTGQTPIYYNGYATGRPQQGKDDPNRCCSRYLDIPNEPLYPFGYGLSYTEFDISEVQLSRECFRQGSGESIKAFAQVRNTGTVAGTEVLQLYIRDITASVVRPVRELKGFKKVTLNPGETCRIEFEITEDMLCFYTNRGTFEAEKGEFILWIGNSSLTENQTKFTLI